MPGQLYDASNRVKASSAAGGVTPTQLGPMGTALDANRRICFDTNAVSGNTKHGGHSLNPANQNEFYTTGVNATDQFSGGYRYSNSGALVVAPEGTVQNFSNGDPMDANGALVITLV